MKHCLCNMGASVQLHSPEGNKTRLPFSKRHGKISQQRRNHFTQRQCDTQLRLFSVLSPDTGVNHLFCSSSNSSSSSWLTASEASDWNSCSSDISGSKLSHSSISSISTSSSLCSSQCGLFFLFFKSPPDVFSPYELGRVGLPVCVILSWELSIWLSEAQK